MPEKVEKENREMEEEICVKPVLSSSENRDNNQTASSGSKSTDVSELKMRLERIKRLAKS